MARRLAIADGVAGAGSGIGAPLRGRVGVLVAGRTWLVRGAAACVIAIAVVALAGWMFGLPLLESVAPGWATMKVNTAIALIAAGCALALIEGSEPGLPGFRLGRGLALFLLVLGMLSLGENLLHEDLGIDNLVVPDRATTGAGSRPGLMSPASAISFVFLGGALVNVRSRYARRSRLAQWLAIPALLIATLGVFGYICGVNSIYHVSPYASLGANTVFALMILTSGVLGADPNQGVAAIVLSDTAGGFVARRLLSSLPPAFFAIGVAGLAGQSAGYYDQRFCIAVIMISSMVVSMAAVSWTAFTLRRIDLDRRAAEQELEAVNAQLVARGERLALVQAELEHQARLSAMGEMAAALAHELNQPLTAAGTSVGAIELFLKDPTKPVDDMTRERMLRAVRQAESQIVRAGDIIRRLRRFVSRGEVDAKPEHLRDLVEDAVALALPSPGSVGVDLRVSVEATAENVLADRVQVQQVIVNLVRNAVEAMREQTQPKIITIDATASADMATVRVNDTGPGLAPDIAARLFSAFLTTKPEGMGVGLSICRHIVETHGGRMWCEPSNGPGADIRFTLRLSRGVAESGRLGAFATEP